MHWTKPAFEETANLVSGSSAVGHIDSEHTWREAMFLDKIFESILRCIGVDLKIELHFVAPATPLSRRMPYYSSFSAVRGG